MPCGTLKVPPYECDEAADCGLIQCCQFASAVELCTQYLQYLVLQGNCYSLYLVLVIQKTVILASCSASRVYLNVARHWEMPEDGAGMSGVHCADCSSCLCVPPS